ncbi:MAG: tripartite tricarboxylate transporter TctB family protein [Pseudomonadota bacterium]
MTAVWVRIDMNDQVDRRFDIGVALVLIVIAAVAIWQAADLPPGTFEPLGSARVPQMTAGLIILLALWVIIRAMLRDDGTSDVEHAGAARAGIVAGLTVLYVAALHFRITTFAIITTVFLTATIFVLVRFDVARLPVILLVAAITGFGCQYLFTRVFVVDLPGL